jgi:hypothetical protein
VSDLPPGPPKHLFNALHSIVGNAASEVPRHVQAPEALAAMALLAAMSVSYQRLIDVPNGRLRLLPINLLAVADVGERKSALESFFAAPMYEHEMSKGLVRDSKSEQHGGVA